FELVHESIWIASHMTFTKHFAASIYIPMGNIGDIVAKDDAQMSSAHLLGMLSGVGLISVSHSPLFLFGVFAVLSPLNIWTTAKMLNAAEFEILNQAKLTLLSRTFIDTGKVVEYDDLRDREIGFGEWIKPYGAKGGVSLKLRLGASAEKAYGSSGEVEGTVSNDVIKAILHASKFHDMLVQQEIHHQQDWDKYSNALLTSLEWSKDKYPKFVAELDSKEWQSDAVYWNDSGMRLTWGQRDPMA
ncbi:hypothetical protein BDF14DRAFT_1716191, partial [Spinellus fusiger]